jgi:hypothetical protein
VENRRIPYITVMENHTFVISSLPAKRAELSGELGEAEKRIARLRADLDCLVMPPSAYSSPR